MKWLLKIWRWFFPKKKPVDTVQDFQVLQKVTEKWKEPEQSFEPVTSKKFKDPRSMTANEKDIYYNQGYKAFEKYKKQL